MLADRTIVLRTMQASAALRAATAAMLLAGCAGNWQPADSVRPLERAPHRATTVYVSSQLGIAGGDASVYDALLLLQPALVQWHYMPHATFAEHEPTVFIDGLRVDNVDVLHRVPCARVRRIQVLDREEARVRYGPDVVGGAILVSMMSW